MKIDFCFSGWVRGANIRWATDKDHKEIDISNMPAQELASKLQSGELHISLGDYLYERHDDVEIELFDFKEKGLFVTEDDLMTIDEWIDTAWTPLPKACYISIQLIDDHYDLEVEISDGTIGGVYGTESNDLDHARDKATELGVRLICRGVQVFKIRSEWDKYLEDS